MSFLSRRYHYRDSSCLQGQQLQAREFLATTATARQTHNSPVSESDEDGDELVSYFPMNLFGEQGLISYSNRILDSDQVPLPVTTVLEQFRLGEGDRKSGSNKQVQNVERSLENGRIHVSAGDVFQWTSSPPPKQGQPQVNSGKNKTIGWTKKITGTGKFKARLGKVKNCSLAVTTTDDVCHGSPEDNSLMIVGTNCETFNKV